MNYKDIKTFKERCEHRPPHMAEIQLHLHEEIAELRHYIEWHLQSKQDWAYPTNNDAS